MIPRPELVEMARKFLECDSDKHGITCRSDFTLGEEHDWKPEYGCVLLASLLQSAVEGERERAEKLAEGLRHMKWCRSCGEDDWAICDGGREAQAALDAHDAALRSTGAGKGGGEQPNINERFQK